MNKINSLNKLSKNGKILGIKKYKTNIAINKFNVKPIEKIDICGDKRFNRLMTQLNANNIIIIGKIKIIPFKKK